MNRQPSLTAIIITKDKKRAQKTKASLTFADEIIIEEQPKIDNFAQARNQALQKARSDWVLFVDDDELVTPALAKEIQQAIQNPKISGYFIYRQDSFLGRTLKHGETAKIRLLRLARKSAGTFNRPVHEVWFIKGKKATLKNPLLHTPHQSIASFLEKINHYSTIEAKYRYEKNKKSSLFHIVIYPLAKFLHNYLFRLGFLDGTPGFIMAVMMSFHSFQTWTKLYLLQHSRHE